MGSSRMEESVSKSCSRCGKVFDFPQMGDTA